MRKFYQPLYMLFVCILFPFISRTQNCSSLQATCKTYESRCTATGAIKISTTGGSGNYRFRTIGPVSSNFTTSDSITGLSAGNYSVIINDITTNCTITITNVIVAGTYQDPRFTLIKTDVSCDNSSNGSITVTDPQFGRAPFLYTIVTPSPYGVGTSNSSGIFMGLPSGDYSIKMTDSCGGIQTRQISLLNYTWWIDTYSFTKTTCTQANGSIRVIDSRGNISTVNGLDGFMYGIVRSAGDTVWSAVPVISFTISGQTHFDVVVKDACGIIKKAPAALSFTPSLGSSVTISNKSCSTFTAKLTSINNFISGNYCLYTASNTLISCNTTGTFNNVPYGNYCIKAKDLCTDTTITRCFNVAPPALSVNNTVKITNKSCSTFTASITSQTGLTNPQFCVYNATDSLISCNTSGIFNNLPYGNYCIRLTDGCRDTTITRCFTVTRAVPVINPVVPSDITCADFDIIVSGDSLNDPLFCLYDSTGAVVVCNNTGIFTGISFGQYCITVTDPCYDTTITRCINVSGPSIIDDLVTGITTRACSTFNIKASGSSLISPTYCLYNSSDSLIACNATGGFNNIPYGSYCIKARNICPDTTFIRCFTVSPPVPSVNAAVNTSNTTCTEFTATITGQVNLSSAFYCAYNLSDSLMACNTDGIFNLPYGSYCIKISSTCYDTTIIRCVNLQSLPSNLSATSAKSCNYGFAKFTINAGAMNLPVDIRILKPDGNLLSQSTHFTSPVIIDSIPGLPSGYFYKIIATDNCGRKDSLNINAEASVFTFNSTITARCPGGSWVNGSGNLDFGVNTNMGSATVQIIKKDGITYGTPLNPNTSTSTVFKFIDLGPGVYIIRCSEYYCNKYLYDTVTINNYEYPNLSRSSAYQCDVNGFSVGAVASNGVGPFTYEIIGSAPSSPSIIAGPQPGPVFNINNGSDYSLIRLRAVDACGNATLGDASILPLASNAVSVDYNCLMMPVNLTVDSMYNSIYSWYKKTAINSIDSVFVGNGPSIHIPYMGYYDIGVYVCHISVNDGCIRRSYYYDLDGSCYIVLPTVLESFEGNMDGSRNELQWKTAQEGNLRYFIVEKRTGTAFNEIGRIPTPGYSSVKRQYHFTDENPAKGINQYRLRLLNADNTNTYSDVVVLGNNSVTALKVYPNPATDLFTVEFKIDPSVKYKASLLTTLKQEISLNFIISEKRMIIKRPDAVKKGMYILRITDLQTNKVFSEKIMFL